MRFSLTDLFLLIACLFAGIFADAGSRLPGARSSLAIKGLAVGVAVRFRTIYLIFTPPIYRFFRLLPLFCRYPHCRRLPDGYRVWRPPGRTCLSRVWPL